MKFYTLAVTLVTFRSDNVVMKPGVTRKWECLNSKRENGQV